jgi:2-hydroxy-6-oxonona-2,4-dienedioate hydrolase
MSGQDTVWCDFLDTGFSQKFYDVNGVRTRAIEAGAGPAMVYLHGGGGHAETWVRNLTPLAAHRHAFAIDMIGHGFTDAPEELQYTAFDVLSHFIQFLDTVAIDRADICGESFGGRIALWTAIRHPDRVNKLVLNTAGGVRPVDDAGRADVDDLLKRTTASLRQSSYETVRARLEWLFADPTQVPEELIKIRQKIYERPEVKESLTKVFVGIFRDDENNTFVTPELLATIKAPTLVIWSDQNPIVSFDTAKELFSHIPDVKFHLIKDAGHWPHYEQFEAYNAVQREFLLG